MITLFSFVDPTVCRSLCGLSEGCQSVERLGGLKVSIFGGLGSFVAWCPYSWSYLSCVDEPRTEP